MSSTNRGAVRVPADEYPTPASAFKPLIKYLPEGGQIWEPSWGDSRLVKWMLEAGIDAWGTDLHNPEFPVDFLKDETSRFCVVTNPPFTLAFEFCQHAVAKAMHTFLLLRLSFLASKARKEWFKKHEPGALFVLSERPSFMMSVSCLDKDCGYKELIAIESIRPTACPTCGRGVKIATSDSTDYAWFYWGTAYRGIFHL
jgi:hypothetical protein